MSEALKKKLEEEIKALDYELNHELPIEIRTRSEEHTLNSSHT